MYRFINVRIKHNSRCIYSDSTGGEVPVITVPVYLQGKLKKLMRKREKDTLETIRDKSSRGNKNVLVVACKRTVFNHYLGQTYKKFEPLHLVSQGWMRSKYCGDYFVINPYGKNPATDLERLRTRSFSELGLHSNVLDGIERLGFKQPTGIQEQAIPAILEGKNSLCCAETGSGKTLAYLAPLFHLMQEHRERFTQERPANAPRSVVLVPGRELAMQIGDVASTLSLQCGMSVSVLVGGQSPEDFRKMRKKHHGLDLVVSTLGIMKRFVHQGSYKLNHVKHVVLDEADTMVDDSFCEPLRHLLRPIIFQEEVPDDASKFKDGAQMILSGATFPLYLNEVFDKIINVESLETIQTSHLHRIMPHVAQKFIRVKARLKAAILLEMVKEDCVNKRGVIVFGNKSSSCHFVTKFLEENGVRNVCLHSDMDDNLRSEHFESFQSGICNVMCCTDLGSRGLDTIRANHVINFDFPNHMSDYIHRSGRTGRVGMRGGLVTNLISKKFEVILVQKIETAARRIDRLPDVNANIQRNINEYVTSKSSDQELAEM